MDKIRENCEVIERYVDDILISQKDLTEKEFKHKHNLKLNFIIFIYMIRSMLFEFINSQAICFKLKRC